MARIQVFLHGQLLSELLMEAGQDFYAGRGSNCQIILANERGISRQHLKFSQEDGKWVVYMIAKYGSLIYDGDAVEKIILEGQVQFSVPPYDFIFSELLTQPSQNLNPSQSQVLSTKDIGETPFNAEKSNVSEAKNASSTGASSANLSKLIANQNQTQDSANNFSLEDSLNPAQKQSSIASPAQSTPQNKMTDEETPAGNLDATSPGISILTPFLKIYNGKSQTEEILKLEGNTWSVGRHPQCDIVINDSAISRKHFEISKTHEGFFVTDLESSNGTLVNDEKITTQKAVKIVSGDVIAVRHIQFVFELHDNEYQAKLQQIENQEKSLVTELQAPLADPYHGNWQHQDMHNSPGALQYLPADLNHNGNEPVLKIPPPNSEGSQGFRPNKIHVIIGLLLLVLVWGLLQSPDKKAPNDGGSNSQGSTTPNVAMDPSKIKEVQDNFNLASSYYSQRKYTLCLAQLEKLHQMVPFHNNSKELVGLCEQGQILEQVEIDRLRKLEAQAEALAKIEKVVNQCRQSMTDRTTTEEINICLQPASELDPQNGKIQELQLEVARREAAKKDAKERQMAFSERQRAGSALFDQAMRHYKTGQLKLALKEFNQFINGRYPGLNQKEDTAQRNIASIKNELQNALNEKISVCQSAMDRSDLKSALIACEAVLKEEPKNSRAQDLKGKAARQLRKEMKTLYDDAALEESMGNIESAKEKWYKILDASLPKEDYFEKAKKKLSKYGLGN